MTAVDRVRTWGVVACTPLGSIGLSACTGSSSPSGGTSTPPAAANAAQSLQTAFTQVVHKVLPSVVEITTSTGSAPGSSSTSRRRGDHERGRRCHHRGQRDQRE